MNQQPSITLRAAYVIVLIAAVLPHGRAEAGWLGLVVGGVGLGLVPSIGPAIFVLLGIYRIGSVVRDGRALASPRTGGVARAVRWLGALLLHGGAVTAAVGWIAPPLMQWLAPERTEIGAEFFTELFLYLANGVGLLGLAMFEFGRLLAFERSARQAGPPAPNREQAR
ncbi:hypothetical protein [Piscinibacter gummiphilus]|uniref:Uncharacterized protein n=1 Tax=Piscinibacter gummiphilus TaxID=946333 RepID=A0A1W6L5J0_9BURK|nr:hypothetical protein [Piscinibacter gummiphilus]ARN19589.1 hypothetical protein A4W93_06485 [Piscinibacter gummiphilus]ATU64258.1 hypothetical protein CPZ87_06570 [Piscinibacter gummiphilus]GLS93457.1 hypothetical protein GCM10007918_07480 [Piscinibacter gummiphilus]